MVKANGDAKEHALIPLSLGQLFLWPAGSQAPPRRPLEPTLQQEASISPRNPCTLEHLWLTQSCAALVTNVAGV